MYKEKPVVYVYSIHLPTGCKKCICICEDAESAIKKIASCYYVDNLFGTQGEYYYIMSHHCF